MKYNWVDLFLALLLLGSFVRGYRNGFLATLFSAVGYVLGGLTALILSMHFVRTWEQAWGKFGLIISSVFIGAAIGEYIFRGSAKFLHHKILFGPFKWIDSLAGAAFSIARSLMLIYIVSALLLVSPWTWAKVNVPQSQIYSQIHKRAPHALSKIQEQITINFASIAKTSKVVTKTNN